MSSEAFCTRADSHADRTIPRNPYSRENFPQLFDMPKPADILLPRGGKLGAGSPVFAKEFLAQNGLGTELLREVGVPKVGHHVLGSSLVSKEIRMNRFFGLAMAFGVVFAMSGVAEARSCCKPARVKCCKAPRTRCCKTERQHCNAAPVSCCNAVAAPCASGCSAVAAPAAAPAVAPQPPVENAPKPAA